jgi:hypothetical protein
LPAVLFRRLIVMCPHVGERGLISWGERQVDSTSGYISLDDDERCPTLPASPCGRHHHDASHAPLIVMFRPVENPGFGLAFRALAYQKFKLGRRQAWGLRLQALVSMPTQPCLPSHAWSPFQWIRPKHSHSSCVRFNCLSPQSPYVGRPSGELRASTTRIFC